ncbi:MAG TPA: thioredoxin [Acidiferrobacterales bacterium]
MTRTAHSADVTLSTFFAEVLDKSRTMPVVVDFWADWCGPCRMLMPVLAGLADEYQGRFFLAKVNADREQELAARYGVRSLPTVKVFRNGAVVDEFLGAQPEPVIRALLDRHIPRPADTLLDAALAAARAGRLDEALAGIEQAAGLDPDYDRVKFARARVLLGLGRLDEGEQVLNSVSIAAQGDPELAALRTQLAFRRIAAGSPPAEELGARIARDPGDLEARYRLSALKVLAEDHAGALEQLLEIVRRDRQFRDDAGRKTMLAVFNLLGGSGELVNAYRRQLSMALN